MSLWCNVHTEKIKENIGSIKNTCKDKKLIGVVKANAYGLGIVGVSVSIQDHVDMLAVADYSEAKKLLDCNSIKTDILILSPLSQVDEFLLVENENIVLSIDSIDSLQLLNDNYQYRIHIYVNTGMNRMGIHVSDVDEVFDRLRRQHKNVKVEGIYTHLHNCSNVADTLSQIELFEKITTKYRDSVEYIHCLASSGVSNVKLREKAKFTTAIRVGNGLYGFSKIDGKSLSKVFSFHAKVKAICNVSKGDSVGYGNLYTAKKDMTVGILPIGNSHGLGVVRDNPIPLIKLILKKIKNSLKPSSPIYKRNQAIEILGNPNMNVTLIDFSNCDKDDVFDLNISPILADFSIDKKYI